MNQPGPDGPATTDDSWSRDLTAACSVLLGRPVDDFDPDAEFVLYYRNRADDDGERLLFDSLDDAAALGRTWLPDDAGARPGPLALCLAPDWGLDLARSVLELQFVKESALARAFGARPGSNLVAEVYRTLTGAELAAALAAHDLRPAGIAADIGHGALTVDVAYRVVTDGTLRDALLTAVRAKRGPDGLRPGPDDAAVLPLTADLFADDPEPLPPAVAAERDRVLAPVGDPRLRAHLWSPYLDRPWDRAADGTTAPAGAVPPDWTSLAARPGTTFVAAWDLAYFGDVSLAVMRVDAPA